MDYVQHRRISVCAWPFFIWREYTWNVHPKLV